MSAIGSSDEDAPTKKRLCIEIIVIAIMTGEFLRQEVERALALVHVRYESHANGSNRVVQGIDRENKE